MAVYDRHYKPFEGTLTSERWRFLVPTRYAFSEVFASRRFLAYYLLCYLAPIVGSLMIYLHHNTEALRVLKIESARQLLPIGAGFFEWFTWFQSIQLYLVVLVVGPTLISADLTNNALALYLSRPFSRSEYLLGKFAVIAILGGAITFVPLSLMLLLQSYLEGSTWLVDHWRFAIGTTLWPMAWILVTGLMALAFSAWLRWRPVATGLLVAIYLASGAFGGMINGVFSTRLGDLVSMPMIIASILRSIYHGQTASGLPALAFWAALFAISALSLLMLRAKVRAYEVVR